MQKYIDAIWWNMILAAEYFAILSASLWCLENRFVITRSSEIPPGIAPRELAQFGSHTCV